ncbi:hypothetical protein C5167_038135 [Papaver somniferum]|uniref:RNase H type-1 domain-containing protein n=1 Tax=Papaver somniferum TaxID=3469 RepID=A0A4Y7ICS0_PAPSO|nr:hypothetical protein C5167_038135 [Papaver somniferum]
MFNICRKVSQKILPHSLKVFVRGSNVEREIKSIPVLDHRSKAIAVLDFRPKTLAVLDHSPKTIAETIAVRDQHPEKKTNHVKNLGLKWRFTTFALNYFEGRLSKWVDNNHRADPNTQIIIKGLDLDAKTYPILVARYKDYQSKRNIVWKKPYKGWAVLNTDGSDTPPGKSPEDGSSTPSSARFGFILRNQFGDLIDWGSVVPEEILKDAADAEIEAVKSGLRLAILKKIRFLLIQMDHESLVNLLNDSLGSDEESDEASVPKIKEILILLQQLEKFEIVHVLREGNKANFISQLKKTDSKVLQTFIPPQLSKILQEDALGRISYRV